MERLKSEMTPILVDREMACTIKDRLKKLEIANYWYLPHTRETETHADIATCFFQTICSLLI